VAFGFFQKTFVIALQPEKGLGIAADDLHKPPARLLIQFWRRRRLAHQLQRLFQLAGVLLQSLAINQ